MQHQTAVSRADSVVSSSGKMFGPLPYLPPPSHRMHAYLCVYLLGHLHLHLAPPLPNTAPVSYTHLTLPTICSV
eukprot:7745305-Alexandrium_andersonii.AAC.1